MRLFVDWELDEREDGGARAQELATQELDEARQRVEEAEARAERLERDRVQAREGRAAAERSNEAVVRENGALSRALQSEKNVRAIMEQEAQRRLDESGKKLDDAKEKIQELSHYKALHEYSSTSRGDEASLLRLRLSFQEVWVAKKANIALHLL